MPGLAVVDLSLGGPLRGLLGLTSAFWRARKRA
jgi:hypothetical protein